MLRFLVTFTTVLLDLSFASPFYSMHPAHIVANIGTTGRNIRHLPCVSRKSNQKGICMFAIDCLKSNGTHLGTCIDRFYFGSCCQIDHVNEIATNTIDAALIPPDRHHQPIIKIQTTSERPFFLKTSNSTLISTSTPSTFSVSLKPSSQLNSVLKETLSTSTSSLNFTTKKPFSTTSEPKYSPTSTKPKYSSSVSNSKYSTTTSKFKYSTTTIKYKYSSTQNTTPKTTTKRTTNLGLTSNLTNDIKNETTTTVFYYGDKITTSPKPKPPSTQKVKLTTEPFKFNTEVTPLPENLSSKPKPSSSNTPFTRKPTTSVLPTKPLLNPKPTKSTVKPQTFFNNGTSFSKTPPGTIMTGTTSMGTTAPKSTTHKTTINSTKLSSQASEPFVSTITEKIPTSTTISDLLISTSQSISSENLKTTSSVTPENLTRGTLSSTSNPLNWLSTSKFTLNNYTKIIINTTTAAPSLTTVSNEVLPIISLQTNGSLQETLLGGNVDTNEIEKGNLSNPVSVASIATVTTLKPGDETTSQPFVTWTIIDEIKNEVNNTEGGWKPITSSEWVLLPIISTVPSVDFSSTSSQVTTENFIDITTELINTTETSFESNITETTITSSKPILQASTTPLSQEPVADNTPLNFSDFKEVCGRRVYAQARIVGGDPSPFGKWPWQVSLRQWRTSTYLHKCGAALLNENWAITAAHCVDNVPPSDLLLRFGEHDLSSENEPYLHQERRVQIVASHPEFDPRTFEYDIALLRFYEPIEFQPNIIPVCVPETDHDFVGATAFVTGWGRLYEDGPLPSHLQEVSVPVLNNSVCESMYRSAGYIEHIPHIFICAGWRKGGFDSCEGDSGGPMVIQRDDKRFVLAGVISWGIGCAEPNQPGVYTRISEFRDWINQILQF